jgi:sulfite reductase (NADPH) hemoprotein beta-component
VSELSRNEHIKAASRRLRGTIADGLADALTGDLAEDDHQLTKFHGLYVQDDRDLRPERARRRLEKAFAFMARLRIPGGVISSAQWLALDRIARERANGSIRLTTRQTVQFHGVIKSNLVAAMRAIDAALLDCVAACGDVNRNVMAAGNPHLSPVHAAAHALADQLSAHFLPRTGAYREIWLDGARVAGGEEEEPHYGPTYLPRKYKMAVAVPPVNDVDVFAHDFGLVAVVEDGRLAGWNVTAGGGMGMTHGEPDTFPRLADTLGFVAPDEAIAAAEAVLWWQRDNGDRSVRKHARLKYTIERLGVDSLKAAVEARLGHALAPARAAAFAHTGDALGWAEGPDGRWHFTLFVENGRIAGQALDALRDLAGWHGGGFVMTPNQNLVIAGVAEGDRARVEAALAAGGLTNPLTGLRANAMACVGLPTCGLALSESERALPALVAALEARLAARGLGEDAVVIRMTGCPNGCARPYLAEIGLVGRGPDLWNLYLGAAADGTRLNKLAARDVGPETIVAALDPLFARWAAERAEGERFGDWCVGAGVVAATRDGRAFHADLAPELLTG